MAHTYASLDAFKAWMVANGATDFGTTDDAAMLSTLEACSRRVDAYCRRSRFGSGFGPRTGTNKYDARGGYDLELDDDLLTLTTATVYAGTGGASSTLTADTDFYWQPYSGPPYRALHMILGSLPVGYRVITIAGTWGQSNETAASTTTVSSGLASGTTATTFTTSAAPTISPGETLKIESEQVYLTGLSSTTATIVRGANGSTAATHANGSAIAVYRYPREVVTTTLLLAQRAWRSRESGLGGDFGGGAIPGTSFRESELSILRRLDADQRIWLVA